MGEVGDNKFYNINVLGLIFEFVRNSAKPVAFCS